MNIDNIHDEILIELSSRISSNLNRSYVFNKGDGGEFEKPSELTLDPVDTKEKIITSITSNFGDSRQFSGYLGINKYKLFVQQIKKFQIIDSCCSTKATNILDLLEKLVTSSDEVDHDCRLDEVSSNMAKLLGQTYRSDYRVLRRNLKKRYSHMFDTNLAFWKIPSTHYYILALEKSFKARIFSFQFPNTVGDNIRSRIIIQIRQELGSSDITYHVGKCDLLIDTQTFISTNTIFP